MLHLLFSAFSDKVSGVQTGKFPHEAYTRAGTVARAPDPQAAKQRTARGMPGATVEAP